jgi:magnesium-transporting ATPase (P-type)
MVWVVIVVITAAQLAITYLPVLQSVFATESVPLWDLLLVVAVGIALFAIVETEKQIRLHLSA